MASARHPKKEIRKALEDAKDFGWIVEPSRGGRSKPWGKVRCGKGGAGQCRISVNSTPKVPENEADKIRKAIAKCPHRERRGQKRR